MPKSLFPRDFFFKVLEFVNVDIELAEGRTRHKEACIDHTETFRLVTCDHAVNLEGSTSLEIPSHNQNNGVC